METYLVGGAVRDQYLGLPVVDRDWVIVGATPETLINAGYRAVGKDFPVFLHPQTQEEYALARTERKTAPGYHGFAFNTDISVTLEEDLQRRDLTINAMALTPEGDLIDPFNGKKDLDARVLRHVSPAFAEDPVRVLRVARFMARLAPFGFSVAEETQDLMQQLVYAGEMQHLVAERVWQEMAGALKARAPRAFFETLHACGACKVVLPELDCLWGTPQVAKYHPEIDTGLHTMMVLDQTSAMTNSAEARFAAICHDLGKGTTPTELLPSHHGHEERGADLTAELCTRLKVPKHFTDLAVLTARWHSHSHRALELKTTTIHKLLTSLDCKRKPERFADFLLVCEADSRGRLTFEDRAYPQRTYLQTAAAAVGQVDAGAIARSTTNKANIPQDIRTAELVAIRAVSTLATDNH